MLFILVLGQLLNCKSFASPPKIAHSQASVNHSLHSLPAPRSNITPKLKDLLSRAQSLYYEGNLSAAVQSYRKATQKAPRLLEAWLNGAVILETLGREKEAKKWYQKASNINPSSDIETALGWCELRLHQLSSAQAAFNRAISENSKDSYAHLGMSRIYRVHHNYPWALHELKSAAKSNPHLTLIPFYEGEIYQREKRLGKAANFYQKVVSADSYFVEAQEKLARIYLKEGQYLKAVSEFERINGSGIGIGNAKWKKILSLLPPQSIHGFALSPSRFYHWLMPVFSKPLPSSGVPLLRIGIGTDHLGRPERRSLVAFYVTSPFTLKDSAGKILAAGNGNQIWLARLIHKGRKTLLSISGPPNTLFDSAYPLTIFPKDPNALIKLESPSRLPQLILAKVVRGEVEFSVFQRNIRIVNTIDLENYTQGVVAAEMPIRSPVEALKAQAVLVRSEALFLKKIWRRHKKQGYDLCDREHCQVYSGVHAESALARRVVKETTGEILTYHGRIAHGIYSADCGGHTQSGEELSGWGKIPYWKGIADGGKKRSWPLSPWDLRQWLLSWPKAFCAPSANVDPSHYRWSRVISIKSLSPKISKKLRIGHLRSVIPLKRSVSGNVNSVLFIGSRGRAIIRDELKIRNLLGIGPLRSTLFVFNTEYDKKGRPDFLVFHGGGWGHGVGMCQSGAMGRATTGQNYKQIIQAYFPGVKIKKLDYLKKK